MASPQKENGNTGIANELLEQLLFFNFPSASPLKIWLFIARKTYGYQKPKDAISLSQVVKGTRLSRQTANESLKWLVKAYLLVKGEITKKGVVYAINKDYELWVVNTDRLVKGRPKSSLDGLTHNKKYYNKKNTIYAPDGAEGVKTNPMPYQEPVIELDEFGDEIEPATKFKLPRGFVAKLAHYYMVQFNVPEVPGIFFGYKQTIDGMIQLSRAIHGNDIEKIEAEIKARIDIAKKYGIKKDWGKIKLSTILENWNLILGWAKEIEL